jgi:hypothetical protein
MRRLGCVLGTIAVSLVAGGTAQAGVLKWSTASSADIALPFGSAHAITAMTCRGASSCVGGDDHGDILLSGNPGGGAGAWRVIRQVDPPLAITGISCPSSKLCVAVSRHGDILTSTNSTRWKVALGAVSPSVGLLGVACASTALCVAFDGSGGVLVSRKPTAGRRSWKFARLFTRRSGDRVASLACPTTTLCVGVDLHGNHVLSSTAPSDGAKSWKLVRIGAPKVPSYAPSSLSCASRSLCVIAGISRDLSDSYVVSSTNPGGSGRAWKVAHRVSGGYLTSISCPSTSLCMADGDPYGAAVIYATHPAGGPGAWRTAYEPSSGGPGTSGVACGSVSSCVLYDASGDVITSNAPTSGQSTWQLSSVDEVNELTAVSCPSTTLCVAADSAGNVVTSATPAIAGSWQPARADWGHRLQSISCATTAMCVAGDNDGRLVSSANPTGGSGAWQVVNVDPLPGEDNPEVDGLSCPAVSLCIAGYYQVLTDSSSQFSSIASSANPTGNATAWTVSAGTVDPGRIPAMSCPTVSFCAGVDGSGSVVTSGNPANGSDAWKLVRIDGHHRLTGVSCPSTSLCVAVDDSGRVLSSVKPAGGTWRAVHLDGGNAFTGVSCASISLCVAIDGERNAFVSTNAAGGVWERAHGVDGDLSGISCPTTSLCVAVDSEGRAIVGKR